MGTVIVFLVGLVFGVILMGLCVSLSEKNVSGDKKKLHDASDKKECYCDKE